MLNIYSVYINANKSNFENLLWVSLKPYVCDSNISYLCFCLSRLNVQKMVIA